MCLLAASSPAFELQVLWTFSTPKSWEAMRGSLCLRGRSPKPENETAPRQVSPLPLRLAQTGCLGDFGLGPSTACPTTLRTRHAFRHDERKHNAFFNLFFAGKIVGCSPSSDQSSFGKVSPSWRVDWQAVDLLFRNPISEH
jgi:hypothetical protein